MKSVNISWTPFALSRIDEIYDYIANEAKTTIPASKQIKMFSTQNKTPRNF